MAEQKKQTDNLSCIAYILGGASFIPLLGVPLGVITILLGLIKIKQGGWKIIAVGISGILFTVILYSSLFYFGFIHRGGIYDLLREQQADNLSTDLVKAIEYYKLVHGKYPSDLLELSKSSSEPVFIGDPTHIPGRDNHQYFYYELDPSGNFYYLLSIGLDGVPFTEDDVLPKVPENERIGLRIKE